MAPEAKAAMAHTEPRPKRFRHGYIAGTVVTAPVNRELLATSRGAAGKQDGFLFALFPLQEFEYHLVIQERIIVMHPKRIAAIKILNSMYRDPLTEVSLEAVNPHIQNGFDLFTIPVAGTWIGDIQDSHSRLPKVCLPRASIRLLQQIALLQSFHKQGRRLGNVRVNPATELQAFAVISFKHSLGIREDIRIPVEITPVIGFHPIAVKMEYPKGNIPLCHPVNEGGHCLLIIVCGKAGGKPETEAPCG